MKKLLALALTAALLTVGVSAQPAAAPALELSCTSALLMEKETGTVLFEKAPHEKLEPASVTKVMTILLIMEALDGGRLKRDDVVTVSAHAAGMGGSQVYLEEGEQFPVWELLKCVVVASGNDAAVALAEHLAGSETEFAARMNQRAAELGMKETNFVNCTGLPAQGHLTSAYDIALMSRALIAHHPTIREYTTIWMDSIRDGAFGLTNTNRLVRFYPGTTGLKTGSTDSAGYCISATAERDGMELIAVVLKSPTGPERFEDAKTMLDYGFGSYALVNAAPDAPLAPVEVLLGTVGQVQPVLQRDSRLLVRKGQEGLVTTEVTLPADVEAPVEGGQVLGEMRVSVDGEARDAVPIVVAEGVERLNIPGIFTRMLRHLLMTR